MCIRDRSDIVRAAPGSEARRGAAVRQGRRAGVGPADGAPGGRDSVDVSCGSRPTTHAGHPGDPFAAPHGHRARRANYTGRVHRRGPETVSYTHLTLPTIYSV